MSFDNSTREIFATQLSSLKENGLFKEERLIHSPQSAEIEVEYPAGSSLKKVINMCANNYLGLASHVEVVGAARAGLDSRGYGMSSVRFICGTQDIHKKLEDKMSGFLGTEDTILFPSCMDANGGVFEALLTDQDVIISDRLIHASIIDGIRLCKAQREIYEHLDMHALEEKLKTHQDKRIRMVVTDGVFSMDGDTAPLDKMVLLCEKYRAMLFVDESHATGLMGKTGRGTHEKYGVIGKIDIITTTFGKALGGASGGCVSGRKELVEMCRQKARPYLFSNTVAPVVIGGVLKVMDMISRTTQYRDQLEENALFWRRSLKEAGFILKEGDTPIVPVMLFNAKLAQSISKDLYAEGVYAIGFFFPVVPKGEARIRTQLSAAHTRKHLESALEAFVKVGKKYDILGKTREEIIAKYGT
jgi:glycine C-acetyltransferase